MIKRIYILFVLVFFYSCNTVILSKYGLEKEKSFYMGLQIVTLYKLTEYNAIDINELKGFPVNEGQDDYMVFEWSLLDKNMEPSLSLIDNISISKSASGDFEEKVYIENLVKEIKLNNERYYISGLYKTKKTNNRDKFNHYYYHFVLDIKEKKIIKFDNRDMW